MLSRSITHRLYDSNEATRIAQTIVLGTGGAMLLDTLGITPDIYHMNEGHSVSLNFYLYAKYKSLEEVRKRVVFTTHTPEMAGNESHHYALLQEMSLFCHLQPQEVHALLSMDNDNFNYTLAALKFAHKANGVSRLHGKVARQMWEANPDICEIISITNAQDQDYWQDPRIRQAAAEGNGTGLRLRKQELKKELFKVVADQCGKLFDPDVLTIVWARRFAGYKRADLIMRDWDRFLKLISNTEFPVQLIWAGKPYPEDQDGTGLFNQIIARTRPFHNCAVLTGYELDLSALLKKGADVWLNTPSMYREASGTSGMTAAMNGAVNLSLPDGWVPEFADDGKNCFLIQAAPDNLPIAEKDRAEAETLMDLLEKEVLPRFYRQPDDWLQMMITAAADVVPAFESGRMAREYYEVLYAR